MRFILVHHSFDFPDMILEGGSIDPFDPPWISAPGFNTRKYPKSGMTKISKVWLCDTNKAIIQKSLVSQVRGDLTGITVTFENDYSLV